jgi:CheY-like chemotaxis protein
MHVALQRSTVDFARTCATETLPQVSGYGIRDPAYHSFRYNSRVPNPGAVNQTVRILLAEDNPADVYLIEEALREHQVPFEITVAEDGEAAIAMLARSDQRPDIVLLDLNMPKRSGGEVLERLRQGSGSELPVIVLTSSDSPSDKEEALRLGATCYIRKPTGLDEFLEIGATVKRLVGNPSASTK